MGIYQQILAGKVTFPRHFDKNAKSLIKKLLVADLTKRFGCLKGGADDIKKHKWFQGFEWETLLARQLQAPIVPTVAGDADTSNFDPYPGELCCVMKILESNLKVVTDFYVVCLLGFVSLY
jgi:hypothetical protein